MRAWDLRNVAYSARDVDGGLDSDRRGLCSSESFTKGLGDPAKVVCSVDAPVRRTARGTEV